MISGMASNPKNKPIVKKSLRLLLAAAVWLLVWQIVYSIIGREVLFASPLSVFQRLFELVGTGGFWLKTGSSLLGITEGYLLGVAAGVLLAVLTSLSDWLYAIFKPMLTVIKSTPVVSFIILALVWMSKTGVPVFISFLMVLPIVWANLTAGIRATDKNLLEMAGVLSPPLPASSSRRVLVKDEAAGMAKLRNLAFPKICEYCGSTINI